MPEVGGAREVNVSFGDVEGSQLVFGDHNVIQTPEGAKVTFLHVDERPLPRLRRLPLSYAGRDGDLVGRKDELGLAGAAAAESPLQIYGGSGIGKTTLLRAVAARKVAAAEGVVLLSTRRRDFDEIAAKLYTAFWESSPPYLPTPAEIEPYLRDREALILLDDCGLDRDDVDSLLDLAPRSTFVLTCERQTLWARGSAFVLQGLDPEAAVELLERQLGRQLEGGELAAAERLVARVEGGPQRLVEAAAAVSSGQATLAALADGGDAQVPLTEPERRILVTLNLLDGAALGSERVAAVTEVPDAAERLAQLERRGWVKSASPRYRLVRELPFDADSSTGGDGELYHRLLNELTLWTERQQAPGEVADEAEAVEAALARAANARDWKQALALAQAAEQQLARAGAWVSWRRVLATGVKSAVMVESSTAEARMRHQLGSLELCLGERDRARTLLEQALALREDLQEEKGAALTRHNLDQLDGGGNGDTDGGDHGDGGGGLSQVLRLPALGAVLAVVGAAIALIALLGGEETPTDPAGGQGVQIDGAGSGAGGSGAGGGSGGGGTGTGSADDVTPEIVVTSPVEGGTYSRGSEDVAEYSCEDSGSGIELCDGSVPIGEPFERSPGPHVFEVRAVDKAGNETTKRIGYSVDEPEPEPSPSAGTSDGPATDEPIGPAPETTTPPPPPPPDIKLN
jgi:hypothetical protein